MKSSVSVIVLVLGALMIATFPASGQTWKNMEAPGVSYSFPTPFKEVNSGGAVGVFYDTTNVYLSVTALSDTTEVTPTTQLQLSRYYAATAATAAIRLRGKMTDTRDTMIGENHAYYTAIDVAMSDTVVSQYELLQFMTGDTLWAFSTQYVKGDPLGEAMNAQFFKGLRFQGVNKGNIPLPLILIFAIPIVATWIFWNYRKRAASSAK